MPSLNVDPGQIAAFDLGGRYVFKQYFDEDDLFQQLEKYYNSDKYRFEVTNGDLPKIRQILDKYFFDIEMIENSNDFCVIRDRQLDLS